MTFSKVSVLVPTRYRVPQLQTMIRSFDLMTTDPASAELVFRIDDDDLETPEYLRGLPWPVVVGPRMKGYRSLPVFFEEMRRVATGDLYLTGNDDMVFQTPDWSRIVLAEANRYPDGIFNIGVSTFNGDHFPFSIISKVAADAMGAIHHPDIFWGDVYLRDIFQSFGRAVRLPEVTIDHQWMGNTPDQVFKDAQQDQHWGSAYWQKHRRLVQNSVDRLRGASL